jgi:hypothetical protein
MRPLPNPRRGDATFDADNNQSRTDLPERMHRIAELFRSYQEQPRLFKAPSTAEQARLIKAGTRPSGPLRALRKNP